MMSCFDRSRSGSDSGSLVPESKTLRVVEWVALRRFLFGVWHY